MHTLSIIGQAAVWISTAVLASFFVYAMRTHKARMAAMDQWTERQRTLGEKLWKRSLRKENERSIRLQVENVWHHPGALDIAKLQHAILTWSDEELDQLAASVRASRCQATAPSRIASEEVRT